MGWLPAGQWWTFFHAQAPRARSFADGMRHPVSGRRNWRAGLAGRTGAVPVRGYRGVAFGMVAHAPPVMAPAPSGRWRNPGQAFDTRSRTVVIVRRPTAEPVLPGGHSGPSTLRSEDLPASGPVGRGVRARGVRHRPGETPWSAPDAVSRRRNPGVLSHYRSVKAAAFAWACCGRDVAFRILFTRALRKRRPRNSPPSAATGSVDPQHPIWRKAGL